MSNDSTKKTLIVALCLCLVCSVVVATAAVLLKPQQQYNKLLDKQRNILSVVGLLEDGGDIKALYDANIEAKVVELSTGRYIEDIDANRYDQRAAATNPELSIKLSRQQDIAGIGRRANQASIYLVRDQQNNVKYYILPVHGYGLWSTMYGLLALEADGDTVYGLSFYEHGETPGLGGEIDNPNWKALWKGKQVFAENGQVKLEVIKGAVIPGTANVDYQVDGLAGATLTSQGVSNLMKFWLNKNGFGPFLNQIRSAKG